jgi:hypothetical protein
MMDQYKKINAITGWIVFTIASVVYIITTEPTASFWDCGEYIATAYKLQVGHPPGAPLFQLIGRFFSLFAFGNTALVAQMVNIMSALSSSFTILFLFWSITMLLKKSVLSAGEMNTARMFAVFGSATVGSLAYTFSDSFWFSAVEGEVYAMSSFFTAIVFWAILKWDEKADEPHSIRWLIFIAYLIGLSVGVHLLNLLAIPAIALVYYFRRYKSPGYKGIFITFLISVALLGLILNGIIPWIVRLAAGFELFFVNSFRLPFNSGTVIYFALLTVAIVWGIYKTHSKQKVVLNSIIWAFTFFLIGYSSFFTLVIRSNANTPIDQNNPENAINLLTYLNREQYGDWPILHGNYFNAPIVDRKDGNPVYRRSNEQRKYIVIYDRKGTIPVYDPGFTTIFPRMWNNTERRYMDDYKEWSKLKGIPKMVRDERGEMTELLKPTFRENLRFFFRYQIDHMYFRYFMWNFSGRQDDLQGFSDRANGNWITGFPLIDHVRLGPVLNTPASLASKAQNKFYMLPLLLGMIGLIYQLRKDRKNFTVVFALFIMTGVAIVVYLNQHSPQPRERDYAYAASFYAFAVWIGMGVYALFNLTAKWVSPKIAAYTVTGISLILIPANMAREGWDDHDRSNRYSALAMAKNYLNSCAANAILFTNGDNDTFPLWYAQEVEGIRTDVRVVNLSLLNTEWYIEQLRRKAYDADPVPFSLPWDQYKDGTRNYSYFVERDNITGPVELSQLFDLLRTNPERLIMKTRLGPVEYLPSKRFKITVDSAQVLRTGTVRPELAGQLEREITWEIRGTGIGKNHLMVLDLLANNNWVRPVYFAITTGSGSFVGLEDYFQMEGLAYRLVPIKTVRRDGMTGRTDTKIMYDNLINKFDFGNMGNPGVYLDETNVRMAMNLRNIFSRLALALADESGTDSAHHVIEHCLELLPNEQLPYSYFTIFFGETYYKTGNFDQGNNIFNLLINNFEEQLEFYFAFTGNRAIAYDVKRRQTMGMLSRVVQLSDRYNQTDIYERGKKIMEKYFDRI